MMNAYVFKRIMNHRDYAFLSQEMKHGEKEGEEQ